MEAPHLPPPKRIDEAVPANLSSGIRHDAGGGALLEARPAPGYAGDVSPQLAYQCWRSGEAVLIDFGLSHHNQLPDLLQEEFRLPYGTAPYMAPERLLGVRDGLFGPMGFREGRRVFRAWESQKRDGRLPATFEIVYGHAWKAEPKASADGRAIIRFHK